jgi:hypothetical protein
MSYTRYYVSYEKLIEDLVLWREQGKLILWNDEPVEYLEVKDGQILFDPIDDRFCRYFEVNLTSVIFHAFDDKGNFMGYFVIEADGNTCLIRSIIGVTDSMKEELKELI